MPRAPRCHVPGGLYHVILRGNHQQAIFRDPGDRDRWEAYLADALDDGEARLHLYCWMTNHVHMTVEVGALPLGRVVMRVASRYARWYQRRLGTTGHLFERRHRAHLVDTDDYLLTLARYIHRNPVSGGVAATVGDYAWSSHHAYVGTRAHTWLVTGRVLGLLSVDPVRARSLYMELMETDSDDSPLAVVAGADDDQADAASAKALPLPRQRDGFGDPAALDRLISQIAREFGVAVEALSTSIRCADLSRARAVIARRAVRTGIATTGDVARRFGCSSTAISKGIARLREEERWLDVGD